MSDENWRNLGAAVVVVLVLVAGYYAYKSTESSKYTPSQAQVQSWCSGGLTGAMQHLDELHGDDALAAAEAVADSMQLGACAGAIQRIRLNLNNLNLNTQFSLPAT